MQPTLITGTVGPVPIYSKKTSIVDWMWFSIPRSVPTRHHLLDVRRVAEGDIKIDNADS